MYVRLYGGTDVRAYDAACFTGFWWLNTADDRYVRTYGWLDDLQAGRITMAKDGRFRLLQRDRGWSALP